MHLNTKKCRYLVAHPESSEGNIEYAEEFGYRLVTVKPNGVLIYRRKNWLEKLLRL